ncbi:MAG: bifunctional diaminohydroxyphosphoribosylaminopyrimidine deaminase/5-amino-6-(5-phosphoribosylamino)uracil reductase RibD [Actinobacteria bacterium]|nr:bifunctional diaminohydroxyphosphoribosylaminopyrimidine deaminase/5-amino-6-(5-phosphoribosylamino)uracil reductase RibD [Actinomycetota bacterium]MCB9388546.1 bifunctional diaminohydroxyphosphoribosylaminopyrimidine deaminase/5-amino-6-(5-phosphoribosylamino)uracil reductase RibD [Acidimicrobiia bacterium]
MEDANPTSTGASLADIAAMTRAVELGELGRIGAPPNPWVGCVIIGADGVVGTGFHERPGEPHAEVRALAAAGPAARGATAVVTLEPCSHTGRTGPCADALIQAGVARVVVGVADPDAQVSGNGIERLRSAGIDVVVDVGSDLVRESLAPYLHHRLTNTCFVVCKVAASIDGRSAARDGSSQWITGPAARDDVHRMRAESQAVVIGSGTAIADDPNLTPRHRWAGPTPLRVVADTFGRVDPSGHLADTGVAPTIIATAEMHPQRRAQWGDVGAEVWDVGRSPRGGLDLGALWRQLAEVGVLQALVEAGPRLGGSIVASGSFQRLVTYVGATWLGAGGRPVFDAPGPNSIQLAERLSLHDVTAFDNDVRLTYAAADIGPTGE